MSSIPLPALDVRVPQQQQNPMEQYAQLLQLKNAMQNAPLQRKILQQNAQAGQLQLQQEQQAQQDQQAFRSAMSDPSMQGKTLGEIADSLAKKGSLSPQTYQQLKKADIEHQQSLATLTKDQLANLKEGHAATQELYNNVMNMPDDQLAQNWPSIAQQYDAIPGNQKMPLNPNQPMTKDQLKQFAPFISMQNAYLNQALERQTKQTQEQTAEAELGQKQAENQFYQKFGGAPGVPVEAQQQAAWLMKNPGKDAADYKKWVMQNSPSAVVMGNMLGGAQNQDALNFAAENYRQTGQLPAGLYRSPGTTQAIIARAAQLDQEAGGQGIAANKASLEANKKSLDNLQKNYDQVHAFEQTAEKNINLLQQTAQKIPDLGARFANVPVRMLNAKMLGTENMAAFNTALNTAQTEAAKVLNSSNASGVLSDSARHELQQIIDGNMPYKAMVSSLNTLKQDMANRNQSYQMQIRYIQGRIKPNGLSSADEVGVSPKLAVGTVESGYRYNGGNPGDPKNWEKVQNGR